MERKIIILGTPVTINGENAAKLVKSPKFYNWLHAFNQREAKPFTIEEGWSHWKGENEDQLVFALLFVRYLNEKGEQKGCVVFYRSDSAAVFLVLRDRDTKERYVALVEQVRAPTGQKILEIPAGSVEAEDDFLSTMIKEVREEVGLKVFPRDLIFLGRYFLSPGACNEEMGLYSCELILDGAEIKELQGKLTGTEGENTKVKLVPWEAFEKLEIRDAKTRLAYELYLKKGASQ